MNWWHRSASASSRAHLAGVSDIATAHRPDLQRLDRNDSGRLAVECHELDLERLSVLVRVNHGPDVSPLQPFVRDVRRQHDDVELLDHRVSPLLTVAELSEKIQGAAIGRQCGLDGFVMSLNRMTHRGVRSSHVGVRDSHGGVRGSESAGSFIVGIEEGLKLPIEIRIHWSQGVGPFLSRCGSSSHVPFRVGSVAQMGRRRLH